MRTSRTSISRPIKVGGIVALVLVLGLAAIVLPLRDWMQALIETIQRLGWTGVLAFALLYIAAVILLLPTWLLTVSAGLAYGLWGIPLVVVSATLGAVLAFVIARRFARQWVSAWAQKRPYVQALDKAVMVEGWKIVGLLRLSPAVPFTLQNYVFGASGISLSDFVISTFFGIIPGTTLYVYIGTLGRVAATHVKFSTPQIALFSVGLLATLIAIIIVTRKARMMLNQIGVTPE